ncbi:MAG: hypothetical protein UR87_C0019G0004 [candidate division CPR3 bacterium GW2011_GWE2_35_7]|uniref:Uncharacterized protein n=1 Tax=candidate division CPR3 bacterium GW2011_GWF2_35_18 TaxID=1618350 RepID=A0A0G0BLK0_UNCC3|nr:MAG: hypothetical protein UR67_C0001G0212 [candidate division CPR3 bacterium GW2011_GWF2_35_18]KKP86445.1 MAG: hypothetical protein UR87_C0019G0004 [candidate division CPR3 bacterium GW2011_GWE2_35_7]
MSEQYENPESKSEVSNRFISRKQDEIQPMLDDLGVVTDEVPNFID